MTNKKPELLIPAGSLANLKAAVVNGADSVYLGLSKFNAREFASNFDYKSLEDAVKICKSNNVKLYLTMNTLIKNSEINDFFKELVKAYERGIDGVIIQDISFLDIIKKYFPDLRVHISTQAGVMNLNHANIVKDADRINLARELDKEKIAYLKNNFSKELEVFIHGALCVCISGSCLFSSFVGGRSGNRGKCSQSCRRKYNDCFYLSTKELCLIDKIPELIQMKVDSLKIEGRMRTPYYVATVTDVYRKAIDGFYDKSFKVTPEIRKRLETAFTREFTEGGYSNENVFNKLKSEGSSEVTRISYNPLIKNIKINRIKPIYSLPKIESKQSLKKQLIVRVYNKRDAIYASESGADIIYYDLFSKDFNDVKNSVKCKIFAVTPRIMFDSDVKKILDEIKQKSPNGIFAGNIGMLNLKLNLPIHLDYNANCFNDINLNFLENKNALPIISPELSLDELKDFKNKNFIVFVHGKIRLMTMTHKIKKEMIQDEKGFKFLIDPIYNGSELLNELELGLFNKVKNLTREGINQIFVDTEYNVKEIVKIYRQILDGKTIDVTKLKNDYVLGWSNKGVL